MYSSSRPADKELRDTGHGSNCFIYKTVHFLSVSELLGVFSYVTMGALLAALLCGFIYDWQRNRVIGMFYKARNENS